jgi:hypothetical protein
VTRQKDKIGLPEIMVYADNAVIWEQNERVEEKRSLRVLTECKDFGSNVSLDKYTGIKISWKSGTWEI